MVLWRTSGETMINPDFILSELQLAQFLLGIIGHVGGKGVKEIHNLALYKLMSASVQADLSVKVEILKHSVVWPN